MRYEGVKTSVACSLPPEKKARQRPRAKRIPSTGGCFGLTDELWALIEPLLPVHKNTHPFGGGRPRMPDRICAEAIFFVAENGLPVERAFGHRPLCFLHSP